MKRFVLYYSSSRAEAIPDICPFVSKCDGHIVRTSSPSLMLMEADEKLVEILKSTAPAGWVVSEQRIYTLNKK